MKRPLWATLSSRLLVDDHHYLKCIRQLRASLWSSKTLLEKSEESLKNDSSRKPRNKDTDEREYEGEMCNLRKAAALENESKYTKDENLKSEKAE